MDPLQNGVRGLFCAAPSGLFLIQDSGLMQEIRAYYASPQATDLKRLRNWVDSIMNSVAMNWFLPGEKAELHCCPAAIGRCKILPEPLP